MNKRTGHTLPVLRRMSLVTVLLAIGLSLGLATSCGKKTGAQQSGQATNAPKLSGSDEVMAALEKKDYDGAMAALLRVKQAVSTEDQQVQFMVLSRQAKDKLLELAPTDSKAAEALTALRGMTLGR